uniref:Uncharacterized protein n=1 Tax=Heterorhabditis bacteriophora TaxID=37862 RepID=A0A1I7WXJ2_HETBA
MLEVRVCHKFMRSENPSLIEKKKKLDKAKRGKAHLVSLFAISCLITVLNITLL